MRRFVRVGLAAASLFGVVATVAPTPAEATTYGTLVFNGAATVSSHGIAYPWVGSNTGDIDLTKSPTHFSSSASVHFVTNTALGAEPTTKKPTPVEAGFATIVGDGFVHGYCGLSEGTLHGTVSIDIPLSGSQHYSFSLSWVAVVPVLMFTGHIQKHGTTHSGFLSGVANTVPVAGSCLNKHAKDFTVNGVISFGMLSIPVSLPRPTLVHTSVL